MRKLDASTVGTLVALGGIVVAAHAGCSKGEEDTGAPPPGFDGGSGGTEAGVFDVFGDRVTSPDCTDPADTDGDFVADQLELAPSTDTDGDTTADFEDLDSDADGYPDADEAANPLLPEGSPGKNRPDPCSLLADTDRDGTPDMRDVDSDGDGVADEDEKVFDPDGQHGCRVKADCDDDGVVDPVELAAGSNPLDGADIPDDATLYFVLPYNDPPKTKDFEFSTGIKKADVYFLIDTTDSMQAAIDNVAASLDTTILPAILNGDPSASPPIPAIPGAWIGVGDFQDVPWAPWGEFGDEVYRSRFTVNAVETLGNMAEPETGPTGLVAPTTIRSILASLQANGGGDAPESLTQALWIATTGQQYAATLGGLWTADAPSCTPPGLLGAPCFRPDALPVLVLVTDAPFHNGPVPAFDYTPSNTGGTRTYQETIDAINGLGAKVVGVSVNTGTAGAARADLSDLAVKTNSLWHDPAFGGQDLPLVTEQDTATGDVSSEVVRLIGLLAGQGLNNVTTTRFNYDCEGGVDCDGDSVVDDLYHNETIPPEATPFDASRFILNVEPVESQEVPLPYATLDDTTFYGVRGDAFVTFRVHAHNTILKPSTLVVMQAVIRVQTPKGQLLGGRGGVKRVFFVIPRYVSLTR